MSRQRRRAARQAWAVGLLATAVVLGAYAAGGLEWAELKTLDLRFRFANSMPTDRRIVCIDIDDDALELVGRWPWPRDLQAGLIDVLREAGLETLLYDIELADPEPVRSLTPRHAGILIDERSLLGLPDIKALPDRELSLTLHDLGGAYLAFHYEATPGTGPDPNGLRMQVRRWLEVEPSRWRQRPTDLFEALFHQVVAGDEQRHEALVLALSNALSYEATLADAVLPLRAVAPIALEVPAISPVYFPHARAAKRCGFVVFEPDVDGIMRRVQLLIEHNGQVLGQLAFAVAFDELGLTTADVHARPGQLILRRPDGQRPLHIQLDERGRALVPWLPTRNWTRQFGEHVPIDAAWQVYDRRLAINHNLALVRDRLAALLEAGEAAPWQQYHDDLKRMLELESELQMARYFGSAADVAQIRAWRRQYQELLADAEPDLRAWIAQAVQPSPTTASNSAAPSAASLLREIERAFSANEAYQTEIDEMLDWLRRRLAGRIGLLGYTATALADMTPIPTHPRAPGVVAHANLLNGLLTGRMVHWAPQWLNLLIAGGLGVLGTLMSNRWGPRVAAIVVVLVVIYVLLAGGLAFYAWSYWIAMTPAIAALVFSYVAVLVHRYVFLERESRQIARALGQYTSATLARQMAEDAELCRRAETREVTAMFTDLQGFTSISERIGAERTQRVLNVALGAFSEVMIHHEGMVNKFIGDGIFAFWNPVIFPQEDHAYRATRTALELQEELRRLVAEQLRTSGDEAFADLVLRIGVATGMAVVGPCGSEQKYDYTCIGDSVNVAARLESANKFYGTRILISGRTRDQAGDDFAYRWLGAVQVKGKQQGVPIYELLGRAGGVPAERLRRAEQLATGVRAFQQRDWSTALRTFEQLTETDADRAAERYRDVCRAFRAQAPPDDWNGALELTEK